MRPMSPRHQQLRDALERLRTHPRDTSVRAAIPLDFRRPTRTAPRNGGHAMPRTDLRDIRIEAEKEGNR